MRAIDIIRLEYGQSKNFMTPIILGRGIVFQNDKVIIAYEYARGRGMPRSDFGHHPTIYGISLVLYNKKTQTTKRLINDSFCTEFKFEVKSRLKSLREVYARNY